MNVIPPASNASCRPAGADRSRTPDSARGRAAVRGRPGSAVTGLVLLLAAIGCATTPTQRRLEGRWLGERIENVETPQLASATGWVRGTSFEFSGANVTVTIPTELPRTGPYDVVQAQERNVVLAIRNPNGAVDTASLTLDGKDSMRWHIGEGRSILFRRY